jgi:hypothetical protein
MAIAVAGKASSSAANAIKRSVTLLLRVVLILVVPSSPVALHISLVDPILIPLLFASW